MIKVITAVLILLLAGCAEEEKPETTATVFDLEKADTLSNNCGDTVFQSFEKPITDK